MPLSRSHSDSDGVVYASKTAKLDKLLSVKRYNQLKTSLRQVLTAKTDAHATVMHCDEAAPRHGYVANLRRALEATPGGRLVRGFKLHAVRLDAEAWGARTVWKAVAHFVVAGADGALADANPAQNEGDAGKPYVFLPSSRVHAELTDAQILSNAYFFGTVIGGCDRFCTAVIIEQQLKGRQLSIIARTPEAAVAKKCIKIRPIPHFLSWCRDRQIAESPVVLGEAMGFITYDVDEEEVDENDVPKLVHLASNNPEALVDGFETLEVELATRNDLLAGRCTVDEAKARHYAHLDVVYRLVCTARAQRQQQRLAAAGFVLASTAAA
jgi:hypothetical protein